MVQVEKSVSKSNCTGSIERVRKKNEQTASGNPAEDGTGLRGCRGRRGKGRRRMEGKRASQYLQGAQTDVSLIEISRLPQMEEGRYDRMNWG